MPRSPRPWFRFYTEAISDRKLRRLPPAQRWLWVVVLADARRSPIPGCLLLTCDGSGMEPITDADLADDAALKVGEVRAGMKAFREMGMLVHNQDLGCEKVARWTERQFDSDEVTQRTRKHRNGVPKQTLERSNNVRRNNIETSVGTPPESETDTDLLSLSVLPVGTSLGTVAESEGNAEHLSSEKLHEITRPAHEKLRADSGISDLEGPPK